LLQGPGSGNLQRHSIHLRSAQDLRRLREQIAKLLGAEAAAGAGADGEDSGHRYSSPGGQQKTIGRGSLEPPLLQHPRKCPAESQIDEPRGTLQGTLVLGHEKAKRIQSLQGVQTHKPELVGAEAHVFCKELAIRSSRPLMNAEDSSVPNRFPSSTASLIETLPGISTKYLSSKIPSRSTLRSIRVIRSTRQWWLWD